MTRDLMDAESRSDDVLMEALFRFLHVRSLDQTLSEALTLLIKTFRAIGGSVFYASTPPRRFQQGQIDDALPHIERWESSVLQRLQSHVWKIQLPKLAPVTWTTLPGAVRRVANVALVGYDRICGVVSLVFPAQVELDARSERLISQFAGAVSEIALSVEQLGMTRRRLSQLGLFYQMGQAMASTFDVERLFHETVELAVTVIDARIAIMTLVDPHTGELVHQLAQGGTALETARRVPLGRGITGWVAEHGEPVLVNNVNEDERFDPLIDGCCEYPTLSVLCVPLQIKGRVIGTLTVLNKVPLTGFDDEDISVLIMLAAQASIALENARLYNSLRVERDRIIEAQEQTRHALARSLHDGPVQMLANLAMRIDLLERLVRQHPEQVSTELDEMRSLTQKAMQDARMLLFELRPVILETQGLVAALQSYVERLRSNNRFTPHLEASELRAEPSLQVAGTIFAIIQEAITNIEKHADADNVWIRISEQPDQLVISVQDDGKGFDIQLVQASYDQGSSFGLLNMRERAELIDGVLHIEAGKDSSRPGTLVRLRIPLPSPEETRHARTTPEPILDRAPLRQRP